MKGKELGKESQTQIHNVPTAVHRLRSTSHSVEKHCAHCAHLSVTDEKKNGGFKKTASRVEIITASLNTDHDSGTLSRIESDLSNQTFITFSCTLPLEGTNQFQNLIESGM